MRKSTRSRGAKALFAAVSTLLVVALTAVAYFAATSGGSGSGQKKLGYGEAVQLTYSVTFNENLKPGGVSRVGITTKDTTSLPTDIASWSLVPSIDEAHAAAGCRESWFEIFTEMSAESAWGRMLEKVESVPIKAGEEVVVSSAEGVEGLGTWGVQYFVRFKEEPVNQSACEGATLVLTAKSTA